MQHRNRPPDKTQSDASGYSKESFPPPQNLEYSLTQKGRRHGCHERRNNHSNRQQGKVRVSNGEGSEQGGCKQCKDNASAPECFRQYPYLCRRKVRDFQYLQNARVGVGFRIDGSCDRLKLPTDLVRFLATPLMFFPNSCFAIR